MIFTAKLHGFRVNQDAKSSKLFKNKSTPHYPKATGTKRSEVPGLHRASTCERAHRAINGWWVCGVSEENAGERTIIIRYKYDQAAMVLRIFFSSLKARENLFQVKWFHVFSVHRLNYILYYNGAGSLRGFL